MRSCAHEGGVWLQRHAIFLPNVSGYSGIFIHHGKNLTNPTSLAEWSQGCIVLDEPDVLRMWGDIAPKDGQNVTVTVLDLPVSASRLPLDGAESE